MLKKEQTKQDHYKWQKTSKNTLGGAKSFRIDTTLTSYIKKTHEL